MTVYKSVYIQEEIKRFKANNQLSFFENLTKTLNSTSYQTIFSFLFDDAVSYSVNEKHTKDIYIIQEFVLHKFPEWFCSSEMKAIPYCYYIVDYESAINFKFDSLHHYKLLQIIPRTPQPCNLDYREFAIYYIEGEKYINNKELTLYEYNGCKTIRDIVDIKEEEWQKINYYLCEDIPSPYNFYSINQEIDSHWQKYENDYQVSLNFWNNLKIEKNNFIDKINSSKLGFIKSKNDGPYSLVELRGVDDYRKSKNGTKTYATKWI